MNEYHKINSVFKRDMSAPNSPFVIGAYSTPELEYLADNLWLFEEKLDGTNIRIIFNGVSVTFRGRTNKAVIPKHLLEFLKEKYTVERLSKAFPELHDDAVACLYGEGIGHKIQKAGSRYCGKEVDFVLIDVKVGHWYLIRNSVIDVALKTDTPFSQSYGEGTIAQAIKMVKETRASIYTCERNPGKEILYQSGHIFEGLVLKPLVPVFARNGSRIITKVKVKDFK